MPPERPPERPEPPGSTGSARPDRGSGAPAGEALLRSRVVASAWALLLARGVTTAGGLVVWMVLSRVLAPGEFGRLTFYLALALLLEPLADLGTSSAALQESGTDPRRLARVLPAVRRVRVASALACVLVWCVVALAFEGPSAGWVLLAGLHPLVRPLEATALAFHDAVIWRVPSLVRGATACARLALVALLAGLGARSMEPYLLAHVALGVAGGVALHLLGRHLLVTAPRAELLAPVRTFAAAWPFGAAAVLQAAYFHVDNLFVRHLAGAEDVGLYNAAVRLFALVVLVPGFATQAALPWLARRRREGTLADAAGRLLRPLALYGAAASVALAAAAAPLLGLVFGARFRDAGPSLVWLGAAVLAVAGGSVLLTSLVALSRGRDVLRIALLAVLVNAGANALLVPRHGAPGAAAATLLTELLVLLLAARALARQGVRPSPGRRGWAAAGAAAILLGALLVARGSPASHDPARNPEKVRGVPERSR